MAGSREQRERKQGAVGVAEGRDAGEQGAVRYTLEDRTVVRSAAEWQAEGEVREAGGPAQYVLGGAETEQGAGVPTTGGAGRGGGGVVFVEE